MASSPVTPLPVHRIDVDAYERIVESGALDDHNVELLDGVLVEVSKPSPEHALTVDRLHRHLSANSRLWVRGQNPLRVPPDSEPQPDLAVLADEPSPTRHPTTALLAVEVSVSTHMIDRNVKSVHYARAGVPVYWLVDVPGRAVEVRSDPGEGAYRRCQIYREGASVPSTLEGIADVDVAELLRGIPD